MNRCKDTFESEKLKYLIGTFGYKTNRKSTETYVLNMLWQKLLQKGCEVQPVAQQIVFGEDGYYFLDLYFPKLGIAVECDEGHHKKQLLQDDKRAKDISSAQQKITPWKKLAAQHSQALQATIYLHHIKAYETDHVSIVKQVDQVVDAIINERNKREQEAPGSTSWVSPKDEMHILREKKELVAGESPDFPTIVSAYNIFLRSPKKGMQRGFFQLGNLNFMLWFPQAPKKQDKSDSYKSQNSGGWVNIIQEDFSILEMNLNQNNNFTTPDRKDWLRLTFVKDINTIGKQIYRFAGVYQCSEKDCSSTGRTYRRVAKGIRWTQTKTDEYPTSIELIDGCITTKTKVQIVS